MNLERLRLFGWVRRIPRELGQRYLDRYSLFKQGASGTNQWRVYLHHFLATDGDGHHNHPSQWSFSVVLFGSYTEEILHRDCGGVPNGTRIERRRIRWFNAIAAEKYHRITELHPSVFGERIGVWTLFFVGPLTGKGWGFWIPRRGHVDHATLELERAAAQN